MKNKKPEITANSEITSIVEAGLAKRCLAAILDYLLAFFLWLFFSMVVMTPIANSAFGYSNTMTLGMTYQTSSHLYEYQQANDNGGYDVIEVKDFTEKIDSSKSSKIVSLVDDKTCDLSYYISHIHYYYTSFLTGLNIEKPNDTEKHVYDIEKDHLVSPDYNTKLSDGTLPKDKYTTKYFNEKILDIAGEGAKYFETPDINTLAFVKEGANEDDARLFLRNLANNAAGDQYYRPYFQDINNKLKLDQLFIAIPPFAFAACLIYILVPLCFKNGETLAKKFLHIGIIDKSGYSSKKRQILFRELIFVAWMALSLFVVGIGITSIATFGLGMFIFLIATIIPKSHRSPYDFAAHTRSVDTKSSVWFTSPIEEEKYAQELKEKMERYKSHEVENKNIIQVGDKILDDNLRKEVEEAQKEEK